MGVRLEQRARGIGEAKPVRGRASKRGRLNLGDQDTRGGASDAGPAARVSGVSQRISRRLRRADGRPTLVLEAVIVVWLLALYDKVNDLAPLSKTVALQQAGAVLRFERSLGMNLELVLNRWTTTHVLVGLIASYYYVAAHFLVTVGVLAFLWWRRPARYRPLRNQLVLINLVGFAVFWLFPLAPPRMLAVDGFHDIIAITGAVGDFHQGGLASAADQYAAMPSLHVAWATWCAMAIWQIFKSAPVRAVAALYPCVTAVVVVATGNHFVLDVLAGVSVALSVALLEAKLHAPRVALSLLPALGAARDTG